MLKRFAAVLTMMLAALSLSGAEAQRTREPPYWASISASRAMMRTGPGRTYPATWLYVRPDLPIQVIEIHENWRKVRDPDGEAGWMLVNLLSDTRTAIVQGGTIQPLHEDADAASPVRYRVEPGVVGRISRCEGGWCLFDVGGRRGFIRTNVIWGVGRDERL